MATLFANSYDLSATGFYFDSFEEFEDKASKLKNSSGLPVEEFEIDYIEGDNPRLFKVAGINQANLELWFDELDHIGDDDDEGIAIRFLMENIGYDLKTAIAKKDDVMLYRGRLVDYAAELVKDCYDFPEIVERYFDYEAFARDLELGGDVVEVAHEIYCTNANDL